MATGTISAGLAFTVVATMAAASVLAGRGRRSGRSGIAMIKLLFKDRARVHPFAGNGGSWAQNGHCQTLIQERLGALAVDRAGQEDSQKGETLSALRGFKRDKSGFRCDR